VSDEGRLNGTLPGLQISSATPDAQPSCKISPRNARSSLHSASTRTVSISTRVLPAPTAPGPATPRSARSATQTPGAASIPQLADRRELRPHPAEQLAPSTAGPRQARTVARAPTSADRVIQRVITQFRAEVLDGFRGTLKFQLFGPWTLAAALEVPRTLNVAIADPRCRADPTASLAKGGQLRRQVRRGPDRETYCRLQQAGTVPSSGSVPADASSAASAMTLDRLLGAQPCPLPANCGAF
jgi:hypothetical protein